MSKTAGDGIYKKFLLQKKVLDTMRTFLEVNDKLLESLRAQSIITADEKSLVQQLHWPQNRNELLQYIIKKSWTLDLLDAFYACLKMSQGQQVVEMMNNEKQFYIEAVGEDIFKCGGAQINFKVEKASKQNDASLNYSNLSNDLDKIMKNNLTAKEKNMIRRLLNERDKEIFQLKIENQELRNQTNESMAEIVVLKNKMHTLDKATADLLACVDLDLNHCSVEQGIGEVKTMMTSLQNTVKELQNDIKAKCEEIRDLRSRMADIMADNTTLRELNETMNEDLHNLEKLKDEITKDLGKKLNLENQEVIRLHERNVTMERRYRSAIEILQEQITILKKELREALQQLKLSDEENVKQKTRLNKLNDRTRKLLVSLNLENDCDDATVALDFARNISYVKRKHSLASQMTKPLPPKSVSSFTSSVTTTDSLPYINGGSKMNNEDMKASLASPRNADFTRRRASFPASSLNQTVRNSDSNRSSQNDLNEISESVEIESIVPLDKKKIPNNI